MQDYCNALVCLSVCVGDACHWLLSPHASSRRLNGALLGLRHSNQASRKLVWDVIAIPKTTLKDLQGSMAEMGVSLQSTISRTLHKAALDAEVPRKKPFLKKIHLKACMELVKSISLILQACGEMFCGQTRLKLNFLVDVQIILATTDQSAFSQSSARLWNPSSLQTLNPSYSTMT